MANPIIEVIDAGHFQRSVTDEEAKKHKTWKVAELRCRACDEPCPCPAVLAARRKAGPPKSLARKHYDVPHFLPPLLK